MKKAISAILCAVFPILSLVSCSKPPELSAIKDRLAELLEASQDVNAVLFGDGLAVYERVTDPRENVTYYKNEETGKAYYWYPIKDEALGDIVAYRPNTNAGSYSYLLKTKNLPNDGKYVYFDSVKGYYYIALENYTEKTYDYYYKNDIPSDYDVVRLDSGYLTTDEIKQYARTVYSDSYLEVVYEALFTGAVVNDNNTTATLAARYSEYTDESGISWLLKSNTYTPLISEKRIFDISTAKIVKPANKEHINITVNSYLGSSPDTITPVRVSLCLQNGVWMLDSATY